MMFASTLDYNYAVHSAGQDIFLLDWRQVLSYGVSFLNIPLVVNSVINLVNNKIHILKY
jgi:hypothetical protein